MIKKYIIPICIIIIIAIGTFTYLYLKNDHFPSTIKVGVLHSLTGTMATSEKPVVKATLMAIDEINQKGGLLGRKIEPIILDGESRDSIFAERAKELILDEKVCVIFGCWTSASRKAVKPIVEQYQSLLFYPVQYEGLEESSQIIYTGASPNQQLVPAVSWCFENLGKKFFLVGSDYVFPRTANIIMKEAIKTLGGEVVGEEYLPLGSSQVKNIIQKIHDTQPEVILNTINGDSNSAFFRELREQKIYPQKIPTMSFSIGETEIRAFDLAEDSTGDYACWNYFQSIDSESNQKFVKNFKKRYGEDQVLSDPMEAGYFGVYLWSQAVKSTASCKPHRILEMIGNQSLIAPEGVVFVDPLTHHTWKTARIGKVQKNGQFKIVWSSKKPLHPKPYPSYRSMKEWNKFLENLSKKQASSHENSY